MTMDYAPINLMEYRTLAKQKLPSDIFDYIDSGVCDEVTKQNNRRAFDRIFLRPFCLRDVSSVNPSVKIFNKQIASPILFSPTAFHLLLEKSGEISTAKASKRCFVPMIVSAMSNISLEDIASHSQNENLWLQVYIFKNRALTKELVQRAEQAKYKAIVVTLGAPVLGKRERSMRNRLSFPAEFPIGNFKMTDGKEVNNFILSELDPSLTWKDIEWLLSITKLPVVLKGIINLLDVEEACQLNVAGIIISNHGGRQLDTTVATISTLRDIAYKVSGRTLVLLDGGVRRGTDIFKAIALGADAVLLGRPVLWSLSVNGENSVVNMVEILKKEFQDTMILSGCRDIQEIKYYSEYLISF